MKRAVAIKYFATILLHIWYLAWELMVQVITVLPATQPFVHKWKEP